MELYGGLSHPSDSNLQSEAVHWVMKGFVHSSWPGKGHLKPDFPLGCAKLVLALAWNRFISNNQVGSPVGTNRSSVLTEENFDGNGGKWVVIILTDLDPGYNSVWKEKKASIPLSQCRKCSCPLLPPHIYMGNKRLCSLSHYSLAFFLMESINSSWIRDLDLFRVSCDKW